MFPEAFSTPPTPRVNETNEKYEGWAVKAERLIFVNGESERLLFSDVRALTQSVNDTLSDDPWRGATVSAEESNATSTATQPIFVHDGWHCSDLYADNGQVDLNISDVQTKGIAKMKDWIKAWEPPSTRSVFSTACALLGK